MGLIDLQLGSYRESAPDVAAVLETDAQEGDLARAARQTGPVGIRFGKFNDGRGFSLARLLRDRHGYAGALRASGHLIPDLAVHLVRSGFNEVEVRDQSHLDHWQRQLAQSQAYQPAWADPPLMRAREGARIAEELSRRIAEAESLEERIGNIAEAFQGRITFSTSLGEEDQAITHAIAVSGAEIDIFSLDTGRLFEETLETLEATRARYGISVRVYAPHAHELEELLARDGSFGFRDSVDKRKACCEIRKVRPLSRALRGAEGWVTGLRRDQSGGRADAPFAVWDAERALVKINPIADWPLETLRAYIAANDIPTNPLHEAGFPSIGCQPCTRAIGPGEDIRAGRWWWESEDRKECGLHVAAAEKGSSP